MNLTTEKRYDGIPEKTPQDEDQQAQASQETARQPSQEAHLAEVTAAPAIAVCL